MAYYSENFRAQRIFKLQVAGGEVSATVSLSDNEIELYRYIYVTLNIHNLVWKWVIKQVLKWKQCENRFLSKNCQTS